MTTSAGSACADLLLQRAQFAAPTRIKERLCAETALRKKAEQKVTRLEQENAALRTRYRNLREMPAKHLAVEDEEYEGDAAHASAVDWS